MISLILVVRSMYYLRLLTVKGLSTAARDLPLDVARLLQHTPESEIFLPQNGEVFLISLLTK